MKQPFLYLAPIRGVTDASFRRIFHRHFPWSDAAIAPFINPQGYTNIKEKHLADLLPRVTEGLSVIPQVINNNADDFLHLAKRLEDEGYDHINWNLGCPAPTIALKKRGSGLLPYREIILRILDEVIPALNARVSIKTRLGYQKTDELATLLPELERYPLAEIIIHPRTGRQMYTGSVHLDSFATCLPLTGHTVVYNGDICSADDVAFIAGKFPAIKRWMLGRGALAFPYLPGEIKGLHFTREEKLAGIRAFHDELYEDLSQRLSGQSHLLSKLKQLWGYLIESFAGHDKARKKILKASSLSAYNRITEELFAKGAINGTIVEGKETIPRD